MLRIGQLARRAGVKASVLRFYEDEGLLRSTDRTDAGYRVYGSEALGRLGFIQRAKALGLSLREIRQLVQEPADPTADLDWLRHAIAHKLADTERRIADLEMLRQDLEALHQRLGPGTAICGRIGDCECWLPTEKEVRFMALNQPKEDPKTAKPATDSCDCCGCPSDDDACSCCGCARG